MCGCMRDSTRDKPCPKGWLYSGNGLIRLHHEERHCFIGKNECSLLEVLKTGRGVEETQRARKRAAVAASIECSPMKSTRKRSSELGLPRSKMRDHMKKDLNVRPYGPTFVNELSDGDTDWRYESCHALLDTFSNAVSRSKVLFSDECARNRNVVFWSKENPNFTQELDM